MESFIARNGSRYNVNKLRNKLNSEKSKYQGKKFFHLNIRADLTYINFTIR